MPWEPTRRIVPEPRRDGVEIVSDDTTAIRPRHAGASLSKNGSTRRTVALFAPAPGLDGVSVYGLTLAKALAARGDKVLVVSPDGPLRRTLVAGKIDWFETASGGGGFFARRRLFDALETFEAGIIHAASLEVGAQALKFAERLGVPSCVTVHGVHAEELPPRGGGGFDGYIASDHFVREKLINECLLDRDRITLIPPAVAAAHPPAESAVGGRSLRPVVGFVGMIEERSGWESFLDAAKAIAEKAPEPMFAVLGAGPAQDALRRGIEERGLVQRMVYVERLFDYGRIWEPFDVVVIDSRQRAAAVLVLEAMAHGLPVVAGEGGAVFDVIEDGVDGLMVARDDPPALVERLLLLVNHAEERVRMGKAAFQRVESRHRLDGLGYALARTYRALEEGDPLPRSHEAGKQSRKVVRP